MVSEQEHHRGFSKKTTNEFSSNFAVDRGGARSPFLSNVEGITSKNTKGETKKSVQEFFASLVASLSIE